MDAIRLLCALEGNNEESFAESAAFILKEAEVSFM
jgi:hypothetical protein